MSAPADDPTEPLVAENSTAAKPGEFPFAVS